MKNRDALRTNKDFRKLKKEDKRQFFADHLNEESKGKLSDAVASTIKTGKEAGGDLIFNGNRLTVIQQKNFHRENFELVLESYDVLASAAKSGRFPEIPLVVHFSELVCTQYGICAAWEQLMQEYAASVKGGVKLNSLVRGLGKIDLNSVWEFICEQAEEPAGQMVRGLLKEEKKKEAFCPGKLEEHVVYRLYRWMLNIGHDDKEAREITLESVEGLEKRDLDRIIRQRTELPFMPFHAHGDNGNFSASDLISTSGSIPSLLLTPSSDFSHVELHIAEPDEMNGAVDLGVIYSFRSPYPLK